MGKSRPAAPPIVDPNQLIQQDAAANRITQFSPYGNLLFGSVGDQGQFVQGDVPEGGQAAAFTQETPFQSQLRMLQENVGLGLGNIASQRLGLPTTYSIAPGQQPMGIVPTGPNDKPTESPLPPPNFEPGMVDYPRPYASDGKLPEQPDIYQLQRGMMIGPDIDQRPVPGGLNIGQTINQASGVVPQQTTGFINVDPTNPFTGPITTGDLPSYSYQDATNLPAFQSQLLGAGTGPTALNLAGLPSMQSSVTGADPLQRSLDTAGLPTLPTDFEDTRRQVTQSVFDRQLGLLQPEFTRQRDQLEQNLADRGLPIGGEAYNQAIDRLERQQGEQQQRLAQQADITGGQEASRLFNMASSARGQLFGEAGQQANLGNQAIQQELSNRLALANLTNQARGQGFTERAAQGEFGLAGQQQAFGQQAANVAQQNAARQQLVADQMRRNELQNQARQALLNERVGLRGQQFNELAALLGGPQIQQPTFFAPSAVNTIGANQLAQSASANAFNQGMANYSSGLGGLFDLAGSLGSAYLLR